MRKWMAVTLAGFCMAAATGVLAQAWPSRPVRVIVPYPAGGVVDVMTRAVTIRLATDLGQPFVVESKPDRKSVV